MEPRIPGEVIRYFVGSDGRAHGGWFVGSVVKGVIAAETSGPKYRTGIATKKEARALAARLNSGCTCDNPCVRCAVHDAEFSDEELGIL